MPRKRTVKEAEVELPEEELEDEELDEEEEDEGLDAALEQELQVEDLADVAPPLGSLYDAEKAMAGFAEPLVVEVPREYRMELFEPGDPRIMRRRAELVRDGWEWPAIMGFQPAAGRPFVILVLSRDQEPSSEVSDG